MYNLVSRFKFFSTIEMITMETSLLEKVIKIQIKKRITDLWYWKMEEGALTRVGAFFCLTGNIYEIYTQITDFYLISFRFWVLIFLLSDNRK